MIKKIALIRTSSAISQAQAEQTAQHIETRYDCTVVYGQECFKPASAEQRAEKLLAHLCDPKIDLLWSVRGGEGSADLIPILEQQADLIQQQKPKYLLGFSDFTALLVYFSQRFGWPSIHGPGARQLPADWLDNPSLSALDHWFKIGTYADITLLPLNAAARRTQHIIAHCTGGNMSLLNISISDIWQLDTIGKVIFIEDWHEKGYVVERTLKYFARIGLFNQAKAVILGDFQAGQLSDNSEQAAIQKNYLQKVLARFAQTLSIPVLQTDRIGHGTGNNLIPYHHLMTLETGKVTRLSQTHERNNHQEENIMPLLHIYLIEGKSDAEHQRIGDAIHEALMETWGIPEDDRFHIFHEKKKSQFNINRTIWGMNRSDDLLVIHITTSPRTTEMKLNFYKRLPEILNEKTGISPDDVFVSMITNTQEDWSFGQGKAQLLEIN